MLLVGTAASDVSHDSPADNELTLNNNSVEELYTADSDDMDNTSTKRLSPSDSPAAKRQQRQRKREQDKLAALKYRNRKKQDILALDKQQTKLKQENTELLKQVKSAEEEITMLKSLLREIYAPCNHGNPTNTNTTVTMLPSVTVVSSGNNNIPSQHQSTDGSHDTSSTSGTVNTCDTNIPQGGVNNTTKYDDMFSIMWNEFFPL